MWIHLIHLEKVRTKAGLSAVRNVTCRHCGGEFHYDFICVADGAANTISGINQEGAARRAVERATARARAGAARAVVPIACPSCGKLQDEMVLELRRRLIARYHGAGRVIPAVLVGIAVGAAMLVSDFGNEPLSPAWIIGLSTIAVAGAFLCAWFGIRIWLEARELQPHFFGRMNVSRGTPGHVASVELPIPAETHRSVF
jgi:hypothetical protein